MFKLPLSWPACLLLLLLVSDGGELSKTATTTTIIRVLRLPSRSSGTLVAFAEPTPQEQKRHRHRRDSFPTEEEMQAEDQEFFGSLELKHPPTQKFVARRVRPLCVAAIPFVEEEGGGVVVVVVLVVVAVLVVVIVVGLE